MEPGPEAEHEVPPKTGIDPEMAELFREEREFAARQRAAEGLETQPDLGLDAPGEDDSAMRARESRERMARRKGEDMADTPAGDPVPDVAPAQDDSDLQAAAAAAAASRREMLPNVDEINQTLRASSEPRGRERPAEPAPRETGSPFARGFMLVVMLACVVVGLYVAAPRLSQQVPQAAPYLDAYVQAVDKSRLWLDARVTALMRQLDGLSSEATAPDAADPPAAD